MTGGDLLNCPLLNDVFTKQFIKSIDDETIYELQYYSKRNEFVKEYKNSYNNKLRFKIYNTDDPNCRDNRYVYSIPYNTSSPFAMWLSQFDEKQVVFNEDIIYFDKWLITTRAKMNKLGCIYPLTAQEYMKLLKHKATENNDIESCYYQDCLDVYNSIWKSIQKYKKKMVLISFLK